MLTILMWVWFLFLVVLTFYVCLYKPLKREYLTWSQFSYFMCGIIIGVIPFYVLYQIAMK